MSKKTNITDIIFNISEELESAQKKFKPFNSGHEGYAVIKEELDELWECVMKNKGRQEMEPECIQIAAMAIRFIIDVLYKL